MLDLLIQLRQ
ncbi:hypothetical protein HPG69_009662 [Diceros bicornis minor]|uniref:Uncharacterized protein n=1 Tax=Diceros bicornis minor TaxID=77932 RepID=A0A7J7EX69_DICBM|nr:hypothetical protein HPG69_009662 [Diceros bicornis minor]